MKKIIFGLILAVLFIFLCACGQTETDKAKWDDAAAALEEAAGIPCHAEVKKNSFINATVNIPESDDFAQFGLRAYRIINAAHDVFAEENGFSIRINKETSIQKYQDNGFVYIIATDGGKKFCTYFDNRDNTLPYNQKVECETPDDLAKFFPELGIRLKTESILTPEELTIWDSVWSALDAEPSADEMDIYEKLAPEFNMTADEMNAFVRAGMEKIYS